MQIVIEIPKELKQKIDEGFTNQVIINKLWDATRNGTVLPKHGRLGDLDYLYKKFEANGCKDSNVYRLIKDEPTILEAWGNKE